MDEYTAHLFNFIQDFERPCAIFISTDQGREDGIREVKPSNIDKILEITNLLRKSGMNAVPCFSKEAADPSTIAVTGGGIQTPVLTPKEAQKTAEQIFKVLRYEQIKNQQNPYNLGTVLPVEISEMADIAQTSERCMRGKSINADMNNPQSAQIREKYGFNLEEQLYLEAFNSPKLIAAEETYKTNEQELKSLFRGGCLGDRPYISLAARESKNLAYSTPDIKTAMMYSGCDGNYGAKMGVVGQNGEGLHFGFVYEFEAGKNCGLYRDYGIELGWTPKICKKSTEICKQDWKGLFLEAPVFPSKNKLKNIYMHIKKDGKDYLYPIDTKDERWKAMLALYRPTDRSKRGYMIERRRRILKEQKVYHTSKAKTFGIFTKRLKPIEISLSKEDLIKVANMTIEEKREQQKAQKNKTAQISRLRGVSGQSVSKPIAPQTIAKGKAVLAYHSKAGAEY